LKPAPSIPEARLARSKELFVCGSSPEATRNFVASQAQRGVSLFALPEELASRDAFSSREVHLLAAGVVAALQAEPRVILHVGLPPIKDASLAEMLAMHLVRVAEAVLHRAEVGHVFAEGGATAVALARRMGWKRLLVSAELAPGVATLSRIDGAPRLLIVKPGSYAWPAATRRHQDLALRGTPATGSLRIEERP